MTTSPRAQRLGIVLATAALVAAAGCGDDSSSTPPTASPATTSTITEPIIDPGDGGEYRPDVTAADFVDGIDNPYLPLRPGARWVYESDEGGDTERIVVEVLTERHEVFGVSAVVVRDQAFVNGELAEDTLDWFAQDRDGNVWYLGEDTAEYENGRVTTRAGSWAAGEDGALPGVVMPADPAPGDAYRQEFYAGEAEDMGEVLTVDGTVTVPVGTFDRVLTTEDWTPLDPEVVEHKAYASGVGLVLEEKVAGDEGRVALVEFTPGR